MDRRLINHFVTAGVASRQDMQRIILRASKDKTSLVTKLLEDGLVTDEVMAQHLAQFYELDLLSLGSFHVEPDALKLLTSKMAQRGGVLPFRFGDSREHVQVAVYDMEMAQGALELLASSTGEPPEPKIAPRRWVIEGLNHFYLNQPSPLFSRSSNESSWRGRQPNPRDALTSRPGSISGARSLSTHNGLDPRASYGGLPSGNGDLDDFLSSEDFGGVDPGLMRDPNLTNLPQASGNISNNPSFWGDGNSSGAAWSKPQPPSRQSRSGGSNPGFSLFDNESEPPPRQDVTIQDIVEHHNDKLRKLRDENKRQREVIQVLVELLVEARVISRRELTKRLKDLRGE